MKEDDYWRVVEHKDYVAHESHMCDYCNCPIEPGSLYSRMVEVKGRGKQREIWVSKQHVEPGCPVDPFDEESWADVEPERKPKGETKKKTARIYKMPERKRAA